MVGIDRGDETMNASLEYGAVSYPHHVQPLVILNRQFDKSRRKEVGDPFLNRFIPKSGWKAAPNNKKLQPMETPVSHVRYWKFTNTDACTTKERCMYILQELQQRHMDVGFGDIRFNFLIGGGGHIFEGRGWKVKPPEDPTYQYDKENHLEIGFIGDLRLKSRIYNAYTMQVQFESGIKLVDYGLKNNLINKDYKCTWRDK